MTRSETICDGCGVVAKTEKGSCIRLPMNWVVMTISRSVRELISPENPSYYMREAYEELCPKCVRNLARWLKSHE